MPSNHLFLCHPLLLLPSIFPSINIFPGGTSGKESTCQCRRLMRHRFDPWIRKIPSDKKWQPTPVFLPGKSDGQMSQVGNSLGVTKHWTWLSTHTYTCKYTQIIKANFPFYDYYWGSDGAKCLMSGIDWVLGLFFKDFSLANLRGQWVASCFLGPEVQTSVSQNVLLGLTASASSRNLLEILILHPDLLNQKPWSLAPAKWVKKAFQEILMYLTSENYRFRQLVMPPVGDCSIVIWHELILWHFMSYDMSSLCQSLA